VDLFRYLLFLVSIEFMYKREHSLHYSGRTLREKSKWKWNNSVSFYFNFCFIIYVVCDLISLFDFFPLHIFKTVICFD
jgi:hypothetical protein